MRVSSVTSPFLIGALKSTRTSTLFPLTSKSLTLRLFTVAPSNANGGEARSLAPDKNLPYKLSPM